MPQFGHDNIAVLSVKVHFDKKTNTKVKETLNLLQYESQHFKCKVEVNILPGKAETCWSIGLVQACDHMFLENRYGNSGSSFWEFHPLKSARYSMVNDSDGVQYPFYSTNTSKLEIKAGDVEETLKSIFLEDHFYPTVAWELPFCKDAQLTEIIRQQKFWIWLVAIRRGTKTKENFNYFNARFDQVYILKTMRWIYNLHMKFDNSKPHGEKLISIMDKQDDHPIVLDYCEKIPFSALSPPHCNAAQSLIWYPKDANESLKVLVPPKQIITPWEIWQTDMGQERKLKVQKPKYCKFIGEWPSYSRTIS